MYSFSDLESVCCSMSTFYWCFLACIQVLQEASKVVWYSHLFENFPQFVAIHTVKGFSIVNEAEVDVYLKFFYDPMDHGTLTSASTAFSKSRLNICIGDVCNCLIVWTFFSTALLGNWDENWPLLVLWPGEGNGKTLQCSCLENPRDVGLWWADVYGVIQSRTWLKQLSSSSSSISVATAGSPDLLTYWVQHFESILFYSYE